MLLRGKRLQPRESRLMLAAGLLLMSSGLGLRALDVLGHDKFGDFGQGFLIGCGLVLELAALRLGRKPG